MTYPVPSWTDNPATSDPIDADNLSLYNSAVTDLDNRATALEAGGGLQALATAKGDMIAAQAVNNMQTIGVGTNGQVLTADSSATLGVDWADPAPGGVSSVTAGDTSVNVNNTDPVNPTVIVNQGNLTVAESQVTSLVTHLAAKQALDSDLTAIAGLTPAANDALQYKSGAWANRTMAQLSSDLGLSTTYQPLDTDLTAIAALTPGSGNVLAADGAGWISKTYAALKTALGLGNVDNTSNATERAATATLTNKTLTSPVINTPTGIVASDVGAQPLDSDLTAIGALTPTNDDIVQRKAGAWTNRTMAQLSSDLGLAATYQAVSAKGAASGYASLDGSTKVPVAQLPTGTSSTTVALGNDGRFTDSRTPSGSAGGSLTGTYPSPTIAAGAITGTEIAAAVKDPAAATAGLRTIGTSAVQACAGNDSRLTDSRTPNVHASTHATGGSDAMAPGDIGALAVSTATTKGDLLVATASATIARLAVGTDAQVFVADSTQTAGVKWAPAPPPVWSSQVETIADGTTMSPDALSGAIKGGVCTALTSDTTLNAPANGSNLAIYRMQIAASGATRTVTLSGWLGTTDNATAAVVIGAGKTASILGEYCATGWLYCGYTLQS